MDRLSILYHIVPVFISILLVRVEFNDVGTMAGVLK